MTIHFEAAKIYTSKIQNALGTQFLIFVAFDRDENKRGIFLVDLGSLPRLDPNDQDGLANAMRQNMKKLVFENDNDPVRDEFDQDGHGHIMYDVAGNDNLLCIGWAYEESPKNHILTLAALRSRQGNSSGNNQIKFEKCPNASRRITNIEGIEDLKVLVIGNDPKLHHIARVRTDLYSMEMAGH